MHAVHAVFVVQMRARREPGLADITDDFALRNAACRRGR